MTEEKTVIKRREALDLISKSSNYGNLGLFIGTGMSKAILKTTALSWKELINKCAEEFDINLQKDIDIEGLGYPEIASKIAKLISYKNDIEYFDAIKKLKEKIAEFTCWYPREEDRKVYGEILQKINPSWIITTNYDLIIECLLTGKCLPLEPNDQLIAPASLIPIYHIHGIRTNPDSIVISQEDYIRLFRPSEYRQQKLPLLMKESTTLIIGYGLNDINVLTAFDWTQNLYCNQKTIHPHEIIQLLHTDTPKDTPYRDHNGIIIIEFTDLRNILSEIAELIINNKQAELKSEDDLDDLDEIFTNPKTDHIKKFIDNKTIREKIINKLFEHSIRLSSSFLVLLSKAMEETWQRAEPKNAFEAYNQNLTILLDILEKIELLKCPPVLLEAIASNLNRTAYYVGNEIGASRSAYNTWEKREKNIPESIKLELKNIATTQRYQNLNKLLEN